MGIPLKISRRIKIYNVNYTIVSDSITLTLSCDVMSSTQATQFTRLTVPPIGKSNA